MIISRCGYPRGLHAPAASLLRLGVIILFFFSLLLLLLAPSYCSFFIWSLLQWVGRAGVTVECTKSSCPTRRCVHDQNLRESGAEWERISSFSCEFPPRFHAVSKSIHASMKINETFSRIRPPTGSSAIARIPWCRQSCQVIPYWFRVFPICNSLLFIGCW